MNLPQELKYFLNKTGLNPTRLKGQNFCIDAKVIEDMVKTANLGRRETVLEVGPGFGFLTVELLKKAKKVVAVELERVLAKVLQKLEKIHHNLEVVNANILDFEMKGRYKIVANLPYQITSAFLRKFLTAGNKPDSMTLLVQKEVAERICTQAGQMNLLAISVQLYGQPEYIRTVSAKSFWPEPKVNSAVLQIKEINDFPFADITEKRFWQVVKSGFCAKRKTLANNLANSLHLKREEVVEKLKAVGLNERVRAQELSLEEWHELVKVLQIP